MPILTRHQPPKFKLSRAWKIFLALLFLVLLIAFKGVLYNLEKNETELQQEKSGVIQKEETVSDSKVSPPPATQNIQPDLTALDTAKAPGNATRVMGNLKILENPTGFLHARDFPGASGSIVFSVKAGSILPYTSLKNGWYQIATASGQTGWVSGQYVTTDLAAGQIPAPKINRVNEDSGYGE